MYKHTDKPNSTFEQCTNTQTTRIQNLNNEQNTDNQIQCLNNVQTVPELWDPLLQPEGQVVHPTGAFNEVLA